MNITKVVLVIHSRLDRVSVDTDLPSPFSYDQEGSSKLSLSFDATPGTGLSYICNNFPDAPIMEVIDAKDGTVYLVDSEGEATSSKVDCVKTLLVKLRGRDEKNSYDILTVLRNTQGCVMRGLNPIRDIFYTETEQAMNEFIESGKHLGG